MNGVLLPDPMSTCTSCGGSGMQRVSGERFRTCLACLGQGQITTSLQPDSSQPWRNLSPDLISRVSLSKPGV